MLTARVRFFARELTLKDTITYNNSDLIRDRLQESYVWLKDQYDAFKYGDVGVPGTTNQKEQAFLFDHINCTFPSSYNTSFGACKVETYISSIYVQGSDALLFQYLLNVDLLVGAYNHSKSLDPTNTYIKNINSIADQLYSIFFESVDRLKAHMKSEFSTVKLNIGIIFGVSIPILLISFLLITPVENNIKMENAR